MFLDNQGNIIINATLTTRGRLLLSKGKDLFKIVKFGLSDSEIDYSLWDASVATDQKGALIEALPILLALPNSELLLQSFLITMPKGTIRLYHVSVPGVADGVNVVLRYTSTTQPILYVINPTTTVIDLLYGLHIKYNNMIDKVIYTDASGVTLTKIVDINEDSGTINGKEFKIITKPFINVGNIQNVNFRVNGLSSGATINFSASFDTTAVQQSAI